MRKRKLNIRINYESNRLAKTYLSDVYEKLIPAIKKPTNLTKEDTDKNDVSLPVKGNLK